MSFLVIIYTIHKQAQYIYSTPYPPPSPPSFTLPLLHTPSHCWTCTVMVMACCFLEYRALEAAAPGRQGWEAGSVTRNTLLPAAVPGPPRHWTTRAAASTVNWDAASGVTEFTVITSLSTESAVSHYIYTHSYTSIHSLICTRSNTCYLGSHPVVRALDPDIAVPGRMGSTVPACTHTHTRSLGPGTRDSTALDRVRQLLRYACSSRHILAQPRPLHPRALGALTLEVGGEELAVGQPELLQVPGEGVVAQGLPGVQGAVVVGVQPLVQPIQLRLLRRTQSLRGLSWGRSRGRCSAGAL